MSAGGTHAAVPAAPGGLAAAGAEVAAALRKAGLADVSGTALERALPSS